MLDACVFDAEIVENKREGRLVGQRARRGMEPRGPGCSRAREGERRGLRWLSVLTLGSHISSHLRGKARFHCVCIGESLPADRLFWNVLRGYPDKLGSVERTAEVAIR